MKTLLACLLLSSAAYGQWYSDVDLIAQQIQSPLNRAEMNEFGFSERVELGYQFEQCGLRTRFWHFDNSYDLNSGPPEIDMGFRFNVLDLEATKQVGDFLISGGFRVADWGISENGFIVNNTTIDPTGVDTTQFGVTIAAEGNTAFCSGENWCLSGVYGGRLSLLTGDWRWRESANTTFQSISQYGNDTQDVLEANAGVEFKYGCAFARTQLEMQRWQSNALSSRGFYDLGLLGIGTTVGVRF